jgi:1-aminocyclopropane-1-carboxylate deaminase/D-cysteine desulfhydrase-like pyridoxal-dependent ACC family enzyme
MTQNVTLPDLRTALDRIPRTRLAIEPTPLVRLPSIERTLARAGPRVFAKMDAYTGFGLGGNKVRKLEFELAPDRLSGITCLITSGGAQSNHARVTAAAAAWLGLECILVLNGPVPSPPTGNALLHRRFGARVVSVERGEDRAPTMERVAQEERERGGHPLVVPLGASTGRGALGYVRAFVELDAQLRQEAEVIGTNGRTWVFVASSSGGTLAGLHLGLALTPRVDMELVGVSADTPADKLRETVEELARRGGEHLGSAPHLPSDHLHVTDDFVGDGYGIETPGGKRAARLFGERGGIVLDPVYTAKAAAGLLEWLDVGPIESEDTVVFLHTGGHPAVFA